MTRILATSIRIPTLMFFRDGQVVDKIHGAPTPEQLRAKVGELRP
jgi:hypothetical protein